MSIYKPEFWTESGGPHNPGVVPQIIEGVSGTLGAKPERFMLAITAHIFLIRDDSVLLLRRFNTGYEDGNYSVLAGHLDGDEEILAAAIREAREEAGISIDPGHIEIVGVMHRRSNDERIDFFLVAGQWQGDVANMEPDKCDELRWFPLGRLPDNTIPYIRRALENYRHGRAFDSFGWPTHG